MSVLGSDTWGELSKLPTWECVREVNKGKGGEEREEEHLNTMKGKILNNRKEL